MRETETDKEKRKTFHGTEEIVEFFLDSLKRYKVIGGLSGRDFNVDKLFSTVNSEKNCQNSMKVLVQFKLLPIEELIY